MQLKTTGLFYVSFLNFIFATSLVERESSVFFIHLFCHQLLSVCFYIFLEPIWSAMAIATILGRDTRISCLKSHPKWQNFIYYNYLMGGFA